MTWGSVLDKKITATVIIYCEALTFVDAVNGVGSRCAGETFTDLPYGIGYAAYNRFYQRSICVDARSIFLRRAVRVKTSDQSNSTKGRIAREAGF